MCILFYFFTVIAKSTGIVLSKHTKKLFSQHGELLLVEAPTGKGGELPAKDLRELAPAGPRRVSKE